MPTDHSFTYVQTIDELDRFADTWLPSIEGQTIAIDIEEDREMHYFPKVALIQITRDGHDAVLDPLQLPHDALTPVVEAICLTPSEIVMHGARNDVVGLKRDFGVGPGPLRDTQIAARFGGSTQFGLANQLETYFGIHLDKAVRRSDWTQRPLDDEQLAYARADTTHLVELWRRLQPMAAEAGWIDAVIEECAALADLPAETINFDPDGWRKVKGARALDADGTRRLAALWLWREQTGEQYNIHPTRVLPPWALINLAERGPRALRKRLSGMDRRIYENHAAELTSLLEHPPIVERRAAPRSREASPVPTSVAKARVEALLAWRKEESDRCGLESGLLAPRNLLESIAKLTPSGPRDFACVDDVRTWRLTRYAECWMELVSEP